MVTLSVFLVTVVSDGKDVLVGTALVALILTAPQLAVIGIQSQLAAADNTVGILDCLLQTAVSLGKLGIGLGVCDSLNLCSSQRIVTPYQLGTCQKCLGSLL